MSRPAAVVTDIEGTTTRIAFVRDTLFPYARERLPALLRERAGEEEVAAALAAVRRLAPGAEPLAALLGWMEQDAKVTPLKELQGILWRDGYARGGLRGDLYPDVGPVLRAWHAAGVRLYAYSSGSVEAQRLLFGHSAAGDLTGLFDGFFDTRIGGKREAASYAALCREARLAPARTLFLSDAEAELDAAAGAGLRVCQLVRAADDTVASARHPAVPDFPAVAALFDLPVSEPPAAP